LVLFNFIQKFEFGKDHDAPPKLLERLRCKSEGENNERKGVRVCSLTHNTLGVRGACWSFRMGIRTNSQAKVQDEINLHNQEKGQLMQIKWKWCDGLNKDNLKHKLYMARNLWEEAPFPSL
jgi:hypothetical protein